MASSNNLDALSQDGELPFGHPGRRFDDTPEGFDHDHRMDQEPEPDYTPDEDGDVVHYGPGDRPLCGSESMTADYTDHPGPGGRMPRLPGTGCRGPRRGQRALGALPPLPTGDLRPERRRVAARRPCVLPALREARMVMYSNLASQQAIRQAIQAASCSG